MLFHCAVHLFLPDDLPDLQEVQEEAEPTVPPVYQVDTDVSHQEPNTRPQPPDTHRLTQLAHIATGPQSPLLQESPLSRSAHLQLHHDSADGHATAMVVTVSVQRPEPCLWNCVSSSSACPSSCSSNLHSYARAVPRTVSPSSGHRSQRSRVELTPTFITEITNECLNVFFSDRRAVKVALPCQPGPLCLKMKT